MILFQCKLLAIGFECMAITIKKEHNLNKN